MKSRYFILLLSYLLLLHTGSTQSMSYWELIKSYFTSEPLTPMQESEKLSAQVEKLLKEKKYHQFSSIIRQMRQIDRKNYLRANEIVEKAWDDVQKHDPKQISAFIDSVILNEFVYPSDLAKDLFFKTLNPHLARAIASNNRFSEYGRLFAKEILNNGAEFSPTMLHLKRYWDDIVFSEFSDIYKQFLENPELKNLYSDFRKKERILNEQGYYTFVHGQQRKFYFPERLYTHLWGLRKKQSVSNFFFTHVKDLVETEEAKLEEDIMRKTIHMAGTLPDSDSTIGVDIERRKRVLFMNYAFFANSGNVGSNSAHYVIENINAFAGSKIKISIKEPFTLLGYDWIYKKNQKEIELLAKDYENLSKYGNMLLIAIPKDKIYKYGISVVAKACRLDL